MNRQTVILVLIPILLASMIVSGVRVTATPSPSGWLYPWKYRRCIWINGANYDLTDYQMLIKFYWSYGFSGYRANSSEDFNDIRFTAADGVTVIPHWKLSELAFYDPTGGQLNRIEIYFLVKIPYIPTNGTWIYVYYGNPISDESTSNASAVLDNYINNFTGWNYEDGVVFHPDGSVEAQGGKLGEPYGRAWSGLYLPQNLTSFRIFFRMGGGTCGWGPECFRAGLVTSDGTEAFGIEWLMPDILNCPTFFHYVFLRDDAGKLYREPLNYSFNTWIGAGCTTVGAIYSIGWCNKTKKARFGIHPYILDVTYGIYPGEPYISDVEFTFDFTDNVTGFGIVAYPEETWIRLYELGFAKFPPDGVEPTQGRYGVEESIVTGYGDAYFSVYVSDIEGEIIDYIPVNITAIRGNMTTGEQYETYSAIVFNGYLLLNDMSYGQYNLSAYFHNIKIAPSRMEGQIWFTLDNTTVGYMRDLSGKVWRLRDYRVRNGTKLKRVYIWDSNYWFRLHDNNPMAPLSNVTIVLEEMPTGGFVFASPFALAIYYGEERPTKVEVVSNATEYSFYWDGNTLIIEGDTGNATVVNINITEYYRLTVEVYDMLGNRLSTSVYLNNTAYRGGLNLTLPVAYYTLSAPSTWKGYELAKIEGGGSTFLLDGEKKIKIYYKVPTKIELSVSEEAPIFDFYHLFTQSLTLKGVLKDAYGNPIPGADITVRSGEWIFKTKTDSEGCFVITNLEVPRGKEYVFTAEYGGSDVYVESEESTSTAVATNWLLLALLLVVFLVIVVAVATFSRMAKSIATARRRRYLRVGY